jgi:competence protein ComEC
MTLAASVATAPLLAVHFEQVSLVSLPANLLAAPAVAPVMWLGAVAATLGGPFAAAVNVVAAPLLAYLAWLGRTAAAVPHASVAVHLPGPLAVAAAYAAMGAGWLLARRVVRRRRAVVVLAAALLAIGAEAARRATPSPPDGFVLSALDIGQGDATLLQHGAHAILVDTGPPGGGIAGKLRRAGVRRLDVLLLTHSSRDHEGALREVLDAVPAGLVVDGRQTREEKGGGEEKGADGGEGPWGEGGGARFEGLPDGVPRTVPEAGKVIRAGPLSLEILWPPPGRDRSGDPNLTATVALARDGPTTALLTADAESPVTLGLDLPDVDILKVAHHGSEDEGLPELLRRITPETAIIPVGENSYGHPAPSTLDALRVVPDVKRTDEDGTVRIGAVAP